MSGLTGLPGVLAGLAAVSVTGLGAEAVGAAFERLAFRGRPAFDDRILQSIARTGLGLIAVSSLVLGLVHLRLAKRGVLFAVLAALALAAAGRLASRLPAIAARLRRPGLLRRPLVWALLAYLLAMTALAALPPAGRDELVYHLEVPRRLLAAGGPVAFPDNIYAHFPKLAEMLTLLGLGTAGETGARLFHVLFGLLTAWAVFRFAAGRFGERGGAWAGALFLSIPSVMNVMPTAYVDLAFTFFGLLGLLAALSAAESRSGRTAFLAGVFLGAAAGVKYTGLQWAALILCLLAFERLKERSFPLSRLAGAAAAGGALVALPHLLPAFLSTGWPIFPFHVPGFRLRPGMNWDPGRARLFLLYLQEFGRLPGLPGFAQILLAPAAVFALGRFDLVPYFDGVLGPVFLLVPILIIRRPLPPWLRRIGLFVLLYLFYWTVTTRQVRFLLPAMPLLCLILAWGLTARRHFAWRAAGAAGLALNLFLGLGSALSSRPVRFLAGAESRDAYLGARVSAYPIYKEAERLRGPGEKIYLVHMKNYGYWLDPPWEADFVFERYRLEAALAEDPTPEAARRFFAARGASLVLVNFAPLDDPAGGLPGPARAALAAFFRDGAEALAVRPPFALFRLKS